ncbi:M24 family metallopeptidase [Nocardioides albertanoniae]|uniref:M24 family metallopeptidase n=1 Tax=Nocardioides albertanoniae TaxID=1175486 RepID=UPI001FE2F7CF|nr:Xaa-Pro peptidase family protein [Nocardioides albertanoniae]
MSVFSSEEFTTRLQSVQQRMAERGWSALVVADPANLYYLTGYNAWSFYVPQCAVVPAEGGVHLFLRAMDAHGAAHTAVLPDDRIHAYPEDLVHRPDIHPYDDIAAQCRELNIFVDNPDVVVAMELDAHFLSVRGFQAVQRAIPRTRIVDSEELVNWVRLVKSPAEQDELRAAGAVADRAMTVALEGVRSGRRECDVVADIQSAQTISVGGVGGDYPAFVPLLPTGDSADTPHLTWTDRVLRRGEATTIELAGVRNRYHAPLARTVCLGPPSAKLLDCAKATNEGMEAALGSMKPGAAGADVHAAFTDVIAAHGLSKESRIGYSVGIGFPPDWGERTVSLRAGEETVLAPGMAFHVILGMWMDGWAYELSESVLVTEHLPEPLTSRPRQLIVNE